MRPLPKLCETCRGKKRKLSTGGRNFYVDAGTGEDRWSCGKRCARRKRARLANRGVQSRIARFTVERVDIFMAKP
jgi:hypothetical protein